MGFHDSNSLHHIFVQIVRLHSQRLHFLFDQVGLYPGQPYLLLALYVSDGQSQRELAEKMNVKPSTIATMVKRMESTGFIERGNDPVDNRISRVYITEKGRNVCKELKCIDDKMEVEVFNNFTPEEQLLLRRLLLQMRDNLKNV